MEAVEGKILKRGGSLVALLFKVGLPWFINIAVITFLIIDRFNLFVFLK